MARNGNTGEDEVDIKWWNANVSANQIMFYLTIMTLKHLITTMHAVEANDLFFFS